MTKIPEGKFSIQHHGRHGTIRFETKEKTLELNWEMSGVKDYHILLTTDDSKNWRYPGDEKIEESIRKEIINGLGKWLDSQKIRSDAFAPIKRSYF